MQLLNLLLPLFRDTDVHLVSEFVSIGISMHLPTRVVDDKLVSSFLKTTADTILKLFGLNVEVLVQAVAAMAYLLHVVLEVFNEHSLGHLKLGVEAHVKLAHQVLHYLFLNFCGHVLLIRTGFSVKVLHSFFHNFVTTLSKVIETIFLTFALELLQFELNFVNSLILDFITPVGSHHFSLIRQIEFLLSSDNLPSFVEEDRETVDRQIFGLVWLLWNEKGVLLTSFEVEAFSQFLAAIFEFVWQVFFVRQKAEVEDKEIFEF